MVENARNSQIFLEPNASVKNQTLDTIVSVTKQVLNDNISNCKNKTVSKNVNDWCIHDISRNISTSLYSKSKTDWSVTVGKSNLCFSFQKFARSVNIEVYAFYLNDLFFEIQKNNTLI
jgi:hypothetical protein